MKFKPNKNSLINSRSFQNITTIIPRIFEELKDLPATPEGTFSVPPLFEREYRSTGGVNA